MFIAHEIGHNFNLRHPFDIAEDKGDLKLQQGKTLENIMDYLPDAQKTYKSFIAKTMPTLGAEREMQRIHEHQKNNKKEVSKRWLGSCSKSYFRDNHYPKTLETQRIPILNRALHPTQSISLRTAEYETRTLGGVRGALRS